MGDTKYITQLAEQAGSTATNSVVGAAMGMILGGYNDRRQLKQQERLQNLQMKGNKEMTDYEYMKQLQMWKDTGYEAQMQQLKEAGLNPALMYKGAGAGGMTIGSGGGGATGGAAAPAGGMEVMNMMAQQAQIALIKAQTEKTKAETQNVPITGENIQASTASLTQGIENAKAQQELTEIQSGIASIEEHIKGQTQNAAIAMIRSELRSATASMHILERNNNIDAATADEKIAIIEAQLITAALNNDAIRKGLAKTDQEIEQIKTAMTVALRTITNAENQTAIDQSLADFERSFGKQAGAILNSLVSGGINIATRRKGGKK